MICPRSLSAKLWSVAKRASTAGDPPAPSSGWEWEEAEEPLPTLDGLLFRTRGEGGEFMLGKRLILKAFFEEKEKKGGGAGCRMLMLKKKNQSLRFDH